MDKLKAAFEWVAYHARAVFVTPSDRCFYCLLAMLGVMGIVAIRMVG